MKVIEAASGEEVLDAAVIGRPDLIIMDKRPPGLSSFEAIRLIRSIISLSVIPIVFLSDYPRRAPPGFCRRVRRISGEAARSGQAGFVAGKISFSNLILVFMNEESRNLKRLVKRAIKIHREAKNLPVDEGIKAQQSIINLNKIASCQVAQITNKRARLIENLEASRMEKTEPQD